MNIRHLEAVLRLAEVELQRDDYVDRTGIYRALLSEAVPYIREHLTILVKERDHLNEYRYAQGLPEIDEVPA